MNEPRHDFPAAAQTAEPTDNSADRLSSPADRFSNPADRKNSPADYPAPDAAAGDTVTLAGRDGKERITIEELAAAAGSFNYETVCGISRRVPRVYLRDGQCVGSVHYLLEKEDAVHVP